MKIELFWIAGCPAYQATRELLEQILCEEKIDAPVEMVQVYDDADAIAKKFLGSPTIHIDGIDPFAQPSQTNFAIQCRVYHTPAGLRGIPSQEMLRTALRRYSS